MIRSHRFFPVPENEIQSVNLYECQLRVCVQSYIHLEISMKHFFTCSEIPSSPIRCFFLFQPLLLQRFTNLCEQHSCSKGNHMNSSQTISKNFYLQGQQNNTGIPNVVLGQCGDLTRWLMHFLRTSPLIFVTNDKSHKFYLS